MKDLYKNISKLYRQTETKKMLLLPAIRRSLKKCLTKQQLKLIDIGCGTGDFYKIAKKLGYKYLGIDSSLSMLTVAKSRNPNVDFKLLSAIEVSKHFKIKFDVALMNLIIQDNTMVVVKKIFLDAKKYLKLSGKIVVGIHHPNYDHYMRQGLFGKQNIITTFRGYFENEQRYCIDYKYNNKKSVRFIDYHWGLGDYFNLFIKLGYKIIYVDECKPAKLKGVNQKKINEKNKYPTYMVIVLSQ